MNSILFLTKILFHLIVKELIQLYGIQHHIQDLVCKNLFLKIYNDQGRKLNKPFKIIDLKIIEYKLPLNIIF